MNAGQLILVSAPSGAGKTSLVNAVLQTDSNLVVAVSHTTRTKRATEVDGVNYHFVSTRQFDTMVAAGEFLEHAQVFQHKYGTAQGQVDTLCAQGRDVVLEIDWQGADQVRQQRPDAISIFVLPPSIDVLRERLAARGQDSAESMQVRLAEAQLDISQAPRYQYVIVNDDFNHAVIDLTAIIHASRLQTQIQLRENQAVKAILSAS